MKASLLSWNVTSIKTWVKSHSQLLGVFVEQERELRIHTLLIVTVESISYTNQRTLNYYELNWKISKWSKV